MGLSLRSLGKKIVDTGENLARGFAGGVVNTAQIPYDVARLGAGAVSRPFNNGQALQNAAQATRGDALGSIGGFVVSPVNKAINAAAQPYAQRLANQQETYAQQVLTPSYRNLYQAYGQNPALGANQASLEAGQAKYGLLNQSIRNSGYSPNDTFRNNALKSGAAIGSGAANALASGAGGILKPALAMGAASGLDTATTDNPTAGDYVKNVAGGIGAGLAIPVVLGGAKVALKGASKLNESSSMTPRGRVNIADQATLRDFSDHLVGANKAKGSELSNLVGQAHEVGKRYGVDLASGTPEQRLAKSNAILDQIGKKQVPSVSADYNPEVNNRLGATDKSIKPKVTLKQLDEPLNTKEYIKQQVEAQKAAAQGDGTKLVKLKEQFRVKFVDALAPIEDPLIKAQGRKGELALRNQLDRSLRADTIAGQFAKENGLHDIIQGVKNPDAFNQYLIAKHAADLEANGIKTGRNSASDAALVKELAPQYEAQAQALQNYNHTLLDKSVEYGLVSPETAAYYKAKYPNYVPFDRIFTDAEQGLQRGKGSGVASLGTNVLEQKIKGSARQVQAPLESILAKTKDIVSQGERNLAAQELVKTKDIPSNPLGIVPLRTAENVSARYEAYKNLAELKPVRDALQKEVTTTTKTLRTLISRNKELGPQILKRIQASGDEVRKNAVTLANDGKRAVNRPDSKRLSRGISEADVNEAFQQYLDGDPRLVRNMYEFLGNKSQTQGLQSTLEGLKNQFEAVKKQRSDLFNEARLNADAVSRGKATISTYKNGIKEIYETTPEVAAAAKSLNKEQMGFVGKIFAVPTRVLRLGATGANAAFALANVAKDTVSAFINTEHSLRASVANPKVFLEALKAASYHGSEAYGELVRQGAGGTSFDIARNAAPETVKRIRADRNVGTKTLYTVTHPGELLRAVENTIGRSEEFGRAVQYFGNKEAALKEGKSPVQAKAYAADAARNNTVNFSRAGEYGRVLNSVLPYLNAGVQGSRTLLRNLKERPAQTTTKIVLTGFIPVATVTAWNLNDPKRKAAYDNISEYEKQNNIIIVPPFPKQDKDGRWNVIKIPVSQEIANLNNIVRNGVEAMAADKNFNFGSLAGDLAGTATSLNAQNPRQLVGQITPQAVKPFAETALNQNLFTGQQLVPDALKNLAPQDQVNKNTSGTARVIGKLTGQSPLKIDNAIRTTTGGLGQNLINMSDTALNKAGVIPADQIGGKSLPTSIANRFNSAQGQTPGSQFFSTIQQEAKNQRLAGKDYSLLNSLIAKEIDPNGNPIPQNEKDALNNNSILANNPRVAAVRASAAIKLAQTLGKPVDPLYQLTPQQQEAYYRMNASIYKGQDYERLVKENQSWLPAFQQKRSDYYKNLNLPNPTTSGKVPYPLSDSQRTLVESYFAISDPKQRSAVLANNPGIGKALDALSTYGNQKRVAQGGAPLDTYPKPTPQVQKIMDTYNAIPKGGGKKGGNLYRSQWIQSHPKEYAAMNQFYAQASLYSLEGEAVAAQYQDTGFSSKGLGDIYNLGQYDVGKYTDANGNTFYALGGNNQKQYGYKPSDPTANPYKYAVSIRGGSGPKAPTPVKAPTIQKAKIAFKGISKPKVSTRKSLV